MMAEAARSLNRVEVRGPDGSVRRVAVRGTRMVIGRAPSCELRVDFDLISRQHAELVFDPFGRWWVRDLGSRNGVKVNGVKRETASIGEGDVIRVGKFEFRLVHEEEAGLALPSSLKVEGRQEGELMVRTLDEGPSPTIMGKHLEWLLEFAKRLAETPGGDQRRRLLCDLMAREELGGLAALVVRWAEGNADPEMLFEPSRVGERAYHVSRTLLRAMRAAGKPVLGSNVSEDGETMKISVDEKVLPIAGIACPMEGVNEAFYLAMEPAFAKTEWLHFAALAVGQWRSAEASWRERERATVHEGIERELKQARRIQMHLLPAAKRIEGLDWHLRMEPCQWVGGDYADVVMLEDGRIFAGVGDVCGKGLHAALVGSSLHTLIRTGLMHNPSLGRVMAEANSYLREFLPAGSFVTFAGLVVDPRTGMAEYLNGGHPAPLVVEGGRVRMMEDTENLPLGLAAEDPAVRQTQLARDAVYLIYTDGCTDVLNSNGDRLSEEDLMRFLEAVAGAGGRGAKGLVEGLFEKLEGYREFCLPPDDRTLLGLAVNQGAKGLP